MTEDDTFNVLRRITSSELIKQYREWCLWRPQHHGGITKPTFYIPDGWSYEEFTNQNERSKSVN